VNVLEILPKAWVSIIQLVSATFLYRHFCVKDPERLVT